MENEDHLIGEKEVNKNKKGYLYETSQHRKCIYFYGTDRVFSAFVAKWLSFLTQIIV